MVWFMRIILMPRQFSILFTRNRFIAFKSRHPVSTCEIRRTGLIEFQNMPGTVVPEFFWKNSAPSLENNHVPIWACRLGNIGSYLLAKQLGFEPLRYLPFYTVNI